MIYDPGNILIARETVTTKENEKGIVVWNVAEIDRSIVEKISPLRDPWIAIVEDIKTLKDRIPRVDL